MNRFPARAYLSEFAAACDRAMLAAGATVRYLAPGGMPVRLRFAGPALGAILLPAFARVHSAAPAGRPVLTVELWDAASTGVFPPPLPLRGGDVPARGEIRSYDDDGVRGMFHSGVRPEDGTFAALTLIDERSLVARHFVTEPERIPWYERAMPLRAVLQRGLIGPERLLAHAGAVGSGGSGGSGVLLTGPKGSGKSTSAVAAVLGGCDFLGDDYVLVDLSAQEPTAHSIYATAKLAPEAIALFPGLEGALNAKVTGENEKRVIDVSVLRPGALRDTVTIEAIVLPRLCGGAATSLRPVAPAEALLALAPTTVFQSPLRDGVALKPLADLTRRVPAYALELGPDPADVGPTLLRLVAARGS